MSGWNAELMPAIDQSIPQAALMRPCRVCGESLEDTFEGRFTHALKRHPEHWATKRMMRIVEKHPDAYAQILDAGKLPRRLAKKLTRAVRRGKVEAPLDAMPEEGALTQEDEAVLETIKKIDPESDREIRIIRKAMLRANPNVRAQMRNAMLKKIKEEEPA